MFEAKDDKMKERTSSNYNFYKRTPDDYEWVDIEEQLQASNDSEAQGEINRYAKTNKINAMYTRPGQYILAGIALG